jgi:NADP-reducing hydrogenase subunit HndD
MPDNIILEIDGLAVTAAPGTTILKAAESIGITIPTICYHMATTSNALCRICVVEVEGARTLIPACVGVVSSGMKVHTQSERVRRARRTILEMLVASVNLDDSPEIQQMLQDYQVEMERFPEAEERKPAVKDDNSLFIRDYAKCILC